MKLYSKKDLTSYLITFKNTAAQKAALTREIKQLKEVLKDEQEAYKNRGKNMYGWLLGERIYIDDIANTKYNIKLCQEVYKLI
jgi:hypothetical protein